MSEESDYEKVRGLNGLFVGQLNDEEEQAFWRLCNINRAYPSFEGTAGFLGAAKVRFVAATPLNRGE